MRLPALVVVLTLTAPTIIACGSDGPGSVPPDRRVAGGELPTSYRIVLTSSCGERSLLGRFRLRVRHDRVVDAQPLGESRMAGLRLDDVPTLAGLVDKAKNAEQDAVVDLRIDDAGIPTSLRIDHIPEAIDDEECYRVTGLHGRRD
jgi:predicted small lipoprotein YifL